MNVSVVSTDVEEWNFQLTQRLIPNSVILAIYFTFGLIGNGLVLLVYKFGFKCRSESRYFIPVLALFDLLASTTCSSFTFALNFQQANFENELFCKSMWFVSGSTTILSVLTLLAITVERYIKVARPFRSSLSIKMKRVIVVAIICISVIVCLPAPIFYGKVSSYNVERNITRWRCTMTKHWKNNEPMIYASILSIFAIFTPVCSFIIYMIIGCKLYKQIKFQKQFQNQFKDMEAQPGLAIFGNLKIGKAQENMPEKGVVGIYRWNTTDRPYEYEGTRVTDLYAESVEEGVTIQKNISELKMKYDTSSTNEHNRSMLKKDVEMENKNSYSQNTSAVTLSVIKIEGTGENDPGMTSEVQRPAGSKVTSTNVKNMNQFTLMFMLIVGLCAVCYLPKIILLILESSSKTFWVDIPDRYLGTALFFYRLYIFNNVCNPFVYCFVDRRFREELKAIVRSFRGN